jgi:hypothetical protein
MVKAIAGTGTAGLAAIRPPVPARGWLRLGGAILLAFLVSGCAAGESSPSLGARLGSTGAVPSEAAASQAPSATPAELLATALAPLQAAAEFETKVTVDDAVVVTSTGRSMGGSSQQTVTTGGKAVEYVHIPPSAWARQSGGSWVLVAADQAPGSPLDALAAPATLEVTARGGTAVTLRATYPAAALGLEGDPITVEITLDQSSVTFTYRVEAAGHLSVSATTVRPSTVQDPIVAPVAST